MAMEKAVAQTQIEESLTKLPPASASTRNTRNKNRNSGNMRRGAARPRSRGQDSTGPRTTEPIILTKKVFNCIVDDSALLAGAKKSTRDGIRKWITNGQIRLFVPLYTLNQAARLKDKAAGRISHDADEALVWLDQATTDSPDLVTLQGGFEKFETWAEVEKFAQPRGLFSETDFQDDVEDADDNHTEQADGILAADGKLDKHFSMSSADSDVSRSASPSSAGTAMSPVSPASSASKSPVRPLSQRSRGPISALASAPTPTYTAHSDSSDVPPHLRDLFNYILWRIHQELDPVAALESFIFLSDDPQKTKFASRFGVRTKSLADIRYVVAREEREYRNRQLVQRKENEQIAPDTSRPSTQETATDVQDEAEEEGLGGSVSDDEELVFKRNPPKAPAAMVATHQASSPRLSNKVIDPNNFSRGSSTVASPTQRGHGRGASSRGASQRGASRGGLAAGRNSTIKVTPAASLAAPAAEEQSSGPIDPNSYVRPPANTNRFRGGRRLWIPT